jgi:hypothetical protein
MLTRNARKDEGPVADSRLAALLDAAAAPAEPGAVPGEERAVSAFRASSARTGGWRSRMLIQNPLTTLGVTAASAGLLLTGGFAAAAAGALPGAAQDTAHEMLRSLNIEVPGADEHSAGHADASGQSGKAPSASGDADSTGTLPDAAAFGQMISELARTTDGGRDKGEKISTAAKSNGNADEHEPEQAAEHPAGGGHAVAPDAGTAAEGNVGQGGERAPVEKPTAGGTGTADGATTDADGGSPSTRGTGTAGEMSDGRSAKGSGNAP